MRTPLSFVFVLLLSAPLQASDLHIACATNFRATLEAIGEEFSKTHSSKLILSSASSGVLFQQLIYGAPFDILLAADADIPARLEARGLTVADSRITYAVGKLVLAYREELASEAGQGLDALLANRDFSLVIANPDHAPYGRAAMQVLEQHPRADGSSLLRGSNVGQAFQMWHAGGADLALVAASYRPESQLEIPADWHQPLRQQAVILKQTQQLDDARAFMAFLESQEIRELIREQGYRLEPVDE